MMEVVEWSLAKELFLYDFDDALVCHFVEETFAAQDKILISWSNSKRVDFWFGCNYFIPGPFSSKLCPDTPQYPSLMQISRHYNHSFLNFWVANQPLISHYPVLFILIINRVLTSDLIGNGYSRCWICYDGSRLSQISKVTGFVNYNGYYGGCARGAILAFWSAFLFESADDQSFCPFEALKNRLFWKLREKLRSYN